MNARQGIHYTKNAPKGWAIIIEGAEEDKEKKIRILLAAHARRRSVVFVSCRKGKISEGGERESPRET